MKTKKTTQKKSYLLYIFLWVWLFIQPTQAQAPDIDSLVNSLTVREKIGQLFIVPFEGQNTEAGSDIAILITDYKVGGVVLQASNANFNNHANTPLEIANLSNQIQAQTLANKKYSLICGHLIKKAMLGPIHESLAVSQLFPTPWPLVPLGVTQHAQDVGRIVGQELAAMGH